MHRLNQWMLCAAMSCLISCAAYASFDNSAVIRIRAVAVVCDKGPIAEPATCSHAGALPLYQGGGLLNGTATGFGDSSGLHTSGSVSAGLTTSGGALLISAYASSQLLDHLHFNVAQPDSVAVSITITTVGTSVGTLSTVEGVGYNASTQLSIANGQVGDVCYFYEKGQCTVSAVVNLSLPLQLRAYHMGGAAVEGTGSGSVDFTAYISAINFTDPNGNVLTVPFTTDSGLAYPMAAVTPEPAPYGALEGAFADLEALLPSATKAASGQIKSAISSLEKALDPKLWEGDDHLGRKGSTVFNEIKNAIHHLQSPKLTNATANEAIVSLVSVLRAVAALSVIESTKDAKEVLKAKSEMSKGDLARAAGDFEEAAERYKKAWEVAT